MPSNELIILIVIAVIVMIIMSLLFAVHRKILLQQSANQQLEAKVVALESQVNQHVDELHEIRTGAIGVGNRVKQLSVSADRLTEKLEEISMLDPATRLYAQASRLVEAGATVEELMQECDLPRAEAELLVSLKK